DYETLAQLQLASRALELNWFTLPPDDPLTGKTIRELEIRGRTGASIVGIMRNGVLHPNPAADYQLLPGDRLAIMGNGEQFAALQELLLTSHSAEAATQQDG